jgi:hypothetical protein
MGCLLVKATPVLFRDQEDREEIFSDDFNHRDAEDTEIFRQDLEVKTKAIHRMIAAIIR